MPKNDVGLAEARRHVLAVVLLQLGLEVERVDLAQAAAEEDVDDVPGLRLEVRAAPGRRPSAGAASRWPPRSSRSIAAIAGRPKAASRRKSRRVEAGVVGSSRFIGGSMDRRVRPSVDEQEFVRVEQHEAELLEPCRATNERATCARARSAAGRTPAARRARPAGPRRRPPRGGGGRRTARRTSP